MLWSNSLAVDFFTLTLIFWVTLYLYFTRNFKHWKNLNVPYVRPLPFFGCALEILTLRKSIGEVLRETYENTKKPFMGFFICDEPCLLIRDPDLVKAVLIKDFRVFDDRTMTNNKKDDPMGSHILFLIKVADGWRDIRRKVSPVFSTGRMKLMYKLIKDVGDELLTYLDKEVAENPVVDVRELTQKYTTDAITSTSFGINANCFKDDNAEFRQVSRRVYNWAILERGISTTCHFIAPTLVKLFRMRFVDEFSANFLRKIFWKTMFEREQSKFVRNDLLDILIDMKNSQKIDDPFKLEGDKLVAQATQFFIAGHETTSSTITFTLYELAKFPEVQKKLREEVIRVRNKHKGFTYEALKEMNYLDMCIKETLRKYPSVPFLDRRAKVDYKLPGTDVVLKRGTAVFISNWAMQMDPLYYPDPEVYDPLRFTDENVKATPQYTYLPFGDGPRNCIGARFGTLSSKSGTAHIISEYQVELCPETGHPIKLDPKGFLLAPIVHLYLKLKKYEG